MVKHLPIMLRNVPSKPIKVELGNAPNINQNKERPLALPFSYTKKVAIKSDH
jgi:hypothetical protein